MRRVPSHLLRQQTICRRHGKTSRQRPWRLLLVLVTLSLRRGTMYPWMLRLRMCLQR